MFDTPNTPAYPNKKPKACASGLYPLFHSIHILRYGGAKGIRTPDPHVANVMLYQLSYRPVKVPRMIAKHFPKRKHFFTEKAANLIPLSLLHLVT